MGLKGDYNHKITQTFLQAKIFTQKLNSSQNEPMEEKK